jgi:hypothetical protein
MLSIIADLTALQVIDTRSIADPKAAILGVKKRQDQWGQ